jgi:hypothetical protein
MSTAIKSIETKWNGTLYRSRLEARYAIFFHELGIKAKYEMASFALPGGRLYQPDFFLPEHAFFVEVKGQEPEGEPAEKILDFAEYHFPIATCVGLPGENLISFHSYVHRRYAEDKILESNLMQWAFRMNNPPRPSFVLAHDQEDCEIVQMDDHSVLGVLRMDIEMLHREKNSEIWYAYDKSRQARFE